jgi:aspartyl-tRNA(Asn)/glutamyl-tRNA(Gln) amidotransferase subunit C
MKVADQLVDKLARLSMLEFDSGEKAAIKKDLERMLDFVEKLNEVDTTGVEPLIFVNPETNVFRPDEVTESLTQAQALKNAPKHDSFYFKVPKVVDNPDK